jgi:hypothetical protein
MFAGVFIGQVDRLGDAGSGDNTAVDCNTDSLGGFSEHVTEICLFHWRSFFFSVKGAVDYFSQVLDYQECRIIRCHITGILLYS